MKLCKDCRWIRSIIRADYDGSNRRRVDSCYHIRSRGSAKSQRKNKKACGPEAKWFEAKEGV